MYLFSEGRGPFEFTQQYTYDNQPDAVHITEDPFDFKIKVEEFDFGCLCTNNNNNNNTAFDDNVIAKCDTAQTNTYLINQLVQDTIVSKGKISSFKETPMFNNQKMADELDYGAAAVTDFTDILFNANCDEYLVTQNKTEDSNSGSEAGHRYPKLKLNITGKIIENTSALSTPEVIQTIADIENDNFNILDIVNEKVSNITSKCCLFLLLHFNFFQEFGSVSTDDLNLDIDQSIPSPPQTVARSIKSRKRKTRDDSDEDYEPPSRIGRKSIKISTSKVQWESDDSSDEDESPKSRRGRPPKRNMSISSDSSKDCDAMRYRELRDKNNEASRRSRLKRKMKEMTLEKEAMDLEERNVKLKTQVEELEKTVNNFRNNLFKIMLNK